MSCYIYVCKYVRASPAVARSVYDPTQIFFTSKRLVIYCFATPTYESETGTANRVGELVIANHLDQSL